jgi:hypothetical protein
LKILITIWAYILLFCNSNNEAFAIPAKKSGFGRKKKDWTN